jgi:hypothetical protein
MFHLCRASKLGGRQYERQVRHATAHDYLVAKHFLHPLCKRLELGLDLLTFLLFILVLKVKTLQLLHAVFIHRIHPVEDHQTLPAQTFEEW